MRYEGQVCRCVHDNYLSDISQTRTRAAANDTDQKESTVHLSSPWPMIVAYRTSWKERAIFTLLVATGQTYARSRMQFMT